MKRLIITILFLLIFLSSSAQEKKHLRGFDGGMMIHTGFLQGNLDAVGYQAKGMPLGIGGVIHIGPLVIISPGHVCRTYGQS